MPDLGERRWRDEHGSRGREVAVVSRGAHLVIETVRDPSLTDAAERLGGATFDEARAATLFARAHGVEAWLAAVAPLDHEAWQDLARQRPRFLAAQARTKATLGDLAMTLGAIDCPFAIVKGPAVAQRLYPRPDLRAAVDLDVLVPPTRFGAVLETLIGAGFACLDLNWPLIERLEPGQLRLRGPRGVLVDLHWSLLNERTLRNTFAVAVDALLERRVIVADVPALDASDQLLHLGLHGALSGGNRLSWLLDVDLAVRAGIDWSEVTKRAAETGMGPPLALMLDRAGSQLGTPAPIAVRAQLFGNRTWASLDRVVAQRWQLPDDPAAPSVSRSWARSTRPTLRASLVEFAAHALAWWRAGRPRQRDTLPAHDAAQPASTLHAVADPAARARYLAAVASPDGAKRSRKQRASSRASS